MEGESIAKDDLGKVQFDSSNPELYFQVGRNLPPLERDELITLLLKFQDVFAWSVYEAPGVSPNLACHSLSISFDSKLIIQRRRKLAPERSEIIMEEIRRLLAAYAIWPVQYPT